LSEKKLANDFELIEDLAESERVLLESSKGFCSTMVWTKEKENVLKTHVTLYNPKEKLLYIWIPKGMDMDAFMRDVEQAGREAYFSISLAWANIFFRTKFLTTDVTGLCFARPERIYKIQRRKDLRFRIPDDQKTHVQVTHPSAPDQPLTRQIFDISASGLSFVISRVEEAAFTSGLILKGVAFQVGEKKIVVDGEVRHLRPIEGSVNDALKVGVSFKNIKAGDAQKIASYVFEESRRFFLRIV